MSEKVVDHAALAAEIDKLGRAWNAFKAENEERLKQIDAKGSADPLLEKKVDTLNDQISKIEANVNKLQLGAPAEQDRDRPEAKEFRNTIRAFLNGDDESPSPNFKFTNKGRELKLHGMGRDEEFRRMQFMARAGRLQEVQAAQSTTNTAGGYTIPQGFSGMLEQALLFYGGMMQEATILTTDTGAALPWPTLNDTTQSGAILAENATIPAQDATFASTTLNAYKYTSKLIAVSWELIQDSFFNIDELVGQLAGTRLGRILNTHFTTGSGSSQPNGVVTAATSGKVGATGQTSTVIYDDLVDLIYSIDISYRQSAIWMMNDASIKVIRKIKDGQSRPLWGDFNNPLSQSYVPSLLGYRLVTNNDVATMAANAKSILFGDFSRYKVRRVRDVTLVRLNERYADNLQTGFFAFARFDGNLIDAGTHPIKYYANSAT